MSDRERKERAESECKLGAKLEKSGKIDAAIEAYLRAVTEYPSHRKAHYRLAELYEERGDLLKSSHHMDMAMHGGPANIPKYTKKAAVKKTVPPPQNKMEMPVTEPKSFTAARLSRRMKKRSMCAKIKKSGRYCP